MATPVTWLGKIAADEVMEKIDYVNACNEVGVTPVGGPTVHVERDLHLCTALYSREARV